MKFPLAKTLSRLLGLLLVTAFAIAVMIASGTKWFNLAWNQPPVPVEEPEIAELAPSPVAVVDLQPARVEITRQYAGMVRPFERFQLAFEVGGRVVELGSDEDPLDEGDRVRKGDVLARLDDRAFQARLNETRSRLKQAQDELARAEDLREKNPRAISDSVLDSRRTDVAVFESQLELAETNLDDARLVAPADGVISQRFVNPGESVNPHEPIFEVLQVDRVLLTVGVPASEIRGVVERQREIERRRQLMRDDMAATAPSTVNGAADSALGAYSEEELIFRAYVDMSGRSPLGVKWETLEGEIYQIDQASDERLGLFEVEIVVPNERGLLRPGQIGTAQLVLDRVEAFRIPIDSAVFTDTEQYFYWLEPAEGLSQADYVARRHDLAENDFLEQERDLIIFDLPPARRTVVIKGQHRLVPGRPVAIVQRNGESIAPASTKGNDETGNDKTGNDETGADKSANDSQSSRPAAATSSPAPANQPPGPVVEADAEVSSRGEERR